jgi:hypothetical protein
MGFKEVASLDADVTIAIGKTNKETGKPYPKSAEGYYLGTREVKSKRGDSQLHFLQTSKGNLGVWGTTDLNRKLSSVPAGTMVRITSTGTKPTPNGDMYTYRVEADGDNVIEVAAQEPSDDSNDHDSADTDAYEGYQTSALAQQSSQSEVEGLLRKGSRKN